MVVPKRQSGWGVPLVLSASKSLPSPHCPQSGPPPPGARGWLRRPKGAPFGIPLCVASVAVPHRYAAFELCSRPATGNGASPGPRPFCPPFRRKLSIRVSPSLLVERGALCLTKMYSKCSGDQRGRSGWDQDIAGNVPFGPPRTPFSGAERRVQTEKSPAWAVLLRDNIF